MQRIMQVFVFFMVMLASLVAVADDQQPAPTQDKMATYMSLAETLNQEAMKVPAYAQLVTKGTAIMAKVGQCKQGGGETNACIAKFQPDIQGLNNDMSKTIKDSIAAGNVPLKTAYDNFNNYAKQNGLKSLD